MAMNHPAYDPTPAWTQEGYEAEMADRIVAAAGRIRHANQECAAIQGDSISTSECRKDPTWRFWDCQRAGAANEIVILVHGMKLQGYDTDPNALGEMLMERYRQLIRNERAGREPTSRVYVPPAWIEGLHLSEQLALAPQIWKSYLAEQEWRRRSA